MARILLAALLTLCCFANSLQAQMIGVETPFWSGSDSYFNRSGVSFGFQLPAATGHGSKIVGLGPGGQMFPNIRFGQNGFSSAVPAFGGYDPGASGRIGFGTLNPGGGGFSLLLEMGKGNSRTVSSTAPSLVVPNGQGGFMFDGEVRPFVTGTVPVVGAALGEALSPWERERFALMGTDPAMLGPPAMNESAVASAQRVQHESAEIGKARVDSLSTATQGARSVAAIRAQRDADRIQREQSIERHLELADGYERRDNPSMARAELIRALTLETRPDRVRALKMRLEALKRIP